MNIQNNTLHETPNHKTTFIHLQFDKKLFAFRYQIYLKGDLLTMIYKCSTYLGRWEIIARCSQVSEETRRASSVVSRRLFESVIRNEPSKINVIDLMSCQSAIVEKNPIWDHLSRDCHVWQIKKMTLVQLHNTYAFFACM